MYVDAYLLDEHAAHIRRERLDDAARVRRDRRARHTDQPATASGSRVERVTAAFRPSPEPCSTC